jgi:hypothetical protein
MRLGLITLSLALILLLMHLILFRFLPGSEVVDLPFLARLHLPTLFVSEPSKMIALPQPLPANRPTGTAPTTFRGPTGEPHVNGPTANPPNY